MRNVLIGALLASAVLTTPALARDGRPYIGIEGGVLVSKDPVLDLDLDGNGAIVEGETDLLALGTQLGWEAGAVLGADFGHFRLEAEAAYKRQGIDSVRTTRSAEFNPDRVTPPGEYDLDGRLETRSFMANALVDFGRDGGPEFFAGGGVGVAEAKADTSADDGLTPYVKDSDSGFAWQLLAGGRMPLTDRVDAGIRYRFFNIDHLHLVNPQNCITNTDFQSHSVLATVSFNLGPARTMGVAPLAVMPPPPPPPPAPEVKTCYDGSVIPAGRNCPLPPPPAPSPVGERG